MPGERLTAALASLPMRQRNFTNFPAAAAGRLTIVWRLTPPLHAMRPARGFPDPGVIAVL